MWAELFSLILSMEYLSSYHVVQGLFPLLSLCDPFLNQCTQKSASESSDNHMYLSIPDITWSLFPKVWTDKLALEMYNQFFTQRFW